MNATETTTPRQRKPRSKPERRIRLCVKPAGPGGYGVLRITVGKDATDYYLSELPADFGRGFRLEKIGLEVREEPYHVNIDGDKRTCDCKGFARWSHCKHSDGLAALIGAGRLPS